MASVEIRKAVKVFGSVEVLHGVDIDIPDQSFAVLVGPSGCGKSTLLRMIAGLEEINGGEIAIGGEVVNRMPPKQRDIAMVFQNYALYPHMTVFDNMGFSLKLSKTSPEVIKQKVEQAAGVLNLTDYLQRYPRQLSGGQRQRVAMGRAIVRDPQVFLFDEPLSNLDAKLRVQMRTEIRELHQRLNSTSVYVTHDQIEAMTMADQIVVMRDGRVEQAGAPLKLYDDPNNTFVATFIGSPAMNTLAGTVMENGSERVLQTAHGTRFQIQDKAIEVGRQVLCGIRPEHFTLSEADEEDAIAMEVAVVEPTGAEVLVIGRNGEQELQAVFRKRHDFKPGQHIHLKPRLDTLLLFDQETGQRIR
jgi:multiple sugar transport system ATP-binding protein